MSVTRPAPRVFSRAASYWTAAAVAMIALWTSGAPSTTYPLYAHDWHLTSTVTTAVFALYPLTLVIVLLVFGDISDHIGRRATILLGMAALLVGTVLFAVAPDITVVFIGRGFMGIGVGLALSPASAAVVEFSKKGREGIAGSVTTAATALGLVLATLIGGALIQYAPFPLHLDFWVLAAAIAAVGTGVWFLPRHTRAATSTPWRPSGVHVARGIRALYVTSALAVSVAYMFGSVFLALGAQIGEELIGTTNLLVVGSVLAVMSVLIGVTAIATRRVPPRITVTIGSVATLLAFALLLESSRLQSLPTFLATTLVSGAAYAMMFAGGLGLIGRGAPAHHRAGTISAVYLVAYVLQGAIAVGLGIVATAHGLDSALVVGSIVVGVFALATLGSALMLRMRAGEASAAPEKGTAHAAAIAAMEE